MRLKGKVILITGGAAGLGKAICLRCPQEGANIITADINLEGAKVVAAEVEKNRAKSPRLPGRCKK